MIQTRPLCLASASPRRAELLTRCGLRFERVSPDVDESPLGHESPRETVARLAEAKSKAARPRFPKHVILGADTAVVIDGGMLGKPASPQDAARMLTALSGRTHRVLSAYCLLDGATDLAHTRVVETAVTFRELPPRWIAWYSAQPEAQDKAGAYGIQGIGGAMILRIEGSYTCVMGLPIEAIVWDLLERGWVTL
ncbi:MAG: Maf family protein [SAR324 cluster bacterium]